MDSKELLRKLLSTGAHSDLTVRCGGHILNLHKSVMCLSSSWFDKACKDGQWMEGTTGVIELAAVDTHCSVENQDLSCDHPDAVRAMIDYIYLGCYHLNAGSSESKEKAARLEPTSIDVKERQANVSLVAKPESTSQKPLAFGSPYVNSSFHTSPSNLSSPSTFSNPTNTLVLGSSSTPSRLFGSNPTAAAYSVLPSTAVSLPRPSQLDPVNVFCSSSTPTCLAMECRIFGLACKYDIPALQQYTVSRLSEKLPNRGLLFDRRDLADALIIAHRTTVDTEQRVRQLLSETLVVNARDFAFDPEIKRAIGSIDGLPYELFQKLVLAKIPYKAV